MPFPRMSKITVKWSSWPRTVGVSQFILTPILEMLYIRRPFVYGDVQKKRIYGNVAESVLGPTRQQIRRHVSRIMEIRARHVVNGRTVSKY